MFKILHIDTELGWRGGENQAFLLAQGLRARGHENLFLTQPGSEMYRRASAAGFNTTELKMRADWDFIARYQLKQIVKALGVDIIHAHTARAHAIALAAAEQYGGRPRLVVSRRVDFAVGGNFFSRRKYLSPLCHYIAISNGVRDALVAGGVSPDRIRIVHSGVDAQRFTYKKSGAAFRSEMGCAPKDFLIGNVAELAGHKGHVYLIDAAARVIEQIPNARFCIVGKGELQESLQQRIRERGLQERFRLAGYRDDVEECFAAFNLFALSSHLEGLCTSVIDAMLLGVPVVATRTGGVPDLVLHEETGLLVPPKDPAAFAEAILLMLRNEPLRCGFAKAARAYARENFTMEKMVEGIEAAYHELLKAP
ncbi:MAG: glycosyltransferase [Candidatus Sumerlaeota bacterium]|nr:glycosyltransferase [Candidatus Sumerlaeota bacterium]